MIPGLFLLYCSITQHLGNYVEMRKGVQLHDKLLTLLPRWDFSEGIFILLYSSLCAIILANLHRPKVILKIVKLHFGVAVVRQICILLIALEPPLGIIVLRDVFLENTVYPHHSPLTKDLFFSGHAASIWIYFLCAQEKYLKMYLGFATLLMSFMLCSMRVHYTYDIYGALFFTTALFIIPSWLKNYYFGWKEQVQL